MNKMYKYKPETEAELYYFEKVKIANLYIRKLELEKEVRDQYVNELEQKVKELNSASRGYKIQMQKAIEDRREMEQALKNNDQWISKKETKKLLASLRKQVQDLTNQLIVHKRVGF